MILYPITFFFKRSSDYLLRFAGLRSIEDNSVSEDMLRMVVNEAVKTEEDGIEGSKATITGKPRVKEMGERYHPEIEINLATGVSTSFSLGRTRLLLTSFSG